MITLPATLRSSRYVVWAIVLAVLLIAVSLLYRHLRPPDNGLASNVKDSVTVLKASRASDSAAHAMVRASAETVYVRSAAQSAQSRITERSASSAHETAQRAAAAARAAETAQDSARFYHAAYDAEQQRGDSLQVALTTEHAAADAARTAALTYQRADSLSQVRLQRVEALNASLLSEVQRISAGCRLLPGVPCPTRKVTALGAAALTYVIVQRVR